MRIVYDWYSDSINSRRSTALCMRQEYGYSDLTHRSTRPYYITIFGSAEDLEGKNKAVEIAYRQADDFFYILEPELL